MCRLNFRPLCVYLAKGQVVRKYVWYRAIFVFRYAPHYTRITGRMRAAHMHPHTSPNEYDNALDSTQIIIIFHCKKSNFIELKCFGTTLRLFLIFRVLTPLSTRRLFPELLWIGFLCFLRFFQVLLHFQMYPHTIQYQQKSISSIPTTIIVFENMRVYCETQTTRHGHKSR